MSQPLASSWPPAPSHAELLEAGWDILTPLCNTAWVAVVAPHDPGSLASKYFGAPWLALDEPWPCVDGEPLSFVLQLAIGRLPLPVRSLLGGTGMVQMFYDRTPGGMGALVRLVQPLATPGDARTPPDGCAIAMPLAIQGWNEHQDSPRSLDWGILGIEAALRTLADQTDQDLGEQLDACLQGDKLGGWPFWTQGNLEDVPRVGEEEMVPFYQLDAGSFYEGPTVAAHAPSLFAPDGTGHLFVLPSDPSQLLFRWTTSGLAAPVSPLDEDTDRRAGL